MLAALAETCAGGLVADIGCGPGHVGAHLAADDVGVVGLDLSPAMCLLARSRGVPAATADMAALPIRSASLTGVVCWYALIHLDTDQRAIAYRELDRVLRPGGWALVAFHTSDAETASGRAKKMTEWWGHEVDLTFHFLDPDQEVVVLSGTGLRLVARMDREPGAAEYPSRRSYLLLCARTKAPG